MSERRVRLGVAVNVSTEARDSRGVRDVYEQVLNSIVHAESLGIDRFLIGQQHFDTRSGPFPSPLVFLAVAAQRTSRIRLGTAVTTLPLEDPLRLAEDAVTVDVVSGGRLELALATGGANLENFAAFGLDPQDSASIFDAKLARFLDAINGAALVPGGSDGDGPRLYPPADGLRNRVWQGTARLDAAVSAARLGIGLHLGTFFDDPITGQLPKVEAYLHAWSQCQSVGTPRVAISRRLHFGESAAGAVARTAPQRDALARHAAGSGVQLLDAAAPAVVDKAAFSGSPAAIADAVAADPVVAVADDFVGAFSMRDDLGADQLMRFLDDLAGEVGPRIGWTAESGAPVADHGGVQRCP